jgi:hypothetical protein
MVVPEKDEIVDSPFVSESPKKSPGIMKASRTIDQSKRVTFTLDPVGQHGG